MKTKKAFLKRMILSFTILCVCGGGAAALLAEEASSGGETGDPTPAAKDAPPAVTGSVPQELTQTNATDPQAQAIEKARANSSSDTVSPGSQLVIRVLEQEELSGVYRVSEDGALAFPLIRERISTAGMTFDDLAKKIADELKKNYFFNVTVLVSRFEGQALSPTYAGGEMTALRGSAGTVYVYGMSRSTTAIEIPPDEALTVSKALIRCGGFGDFANKKKVKLYRKTALSEKTETIVVNVHEILDEGKLEKDVVVQDGDIIVVSEKFWNF